jgi:hypothetical protein
MGKKPVQNLVLNRVEESSEWSPGTVTEHGGLD